jgi:hypothetical protein
MPNKYVMKLYSKRLQSDRELPTAKPWENGKPNNLTLVNPTGLQPPFRKLHLDEQWLTAQT